MVKNIILHLFETFTFGIALGLMPFIVLFAFFGEFDMASFICAACAVSMLISIGLSFFQGD